MSTRALLIFGAGSLARMAHYYATRELGWEVVGFAVDAPAAAATRLAQLPVVAWDQAVATHDPGHTAVFVAVGYRSMLARAAAWTRVRDAGYSTPALVSRHAFVAEDAVLGPNCIVMPGSVIEPGVVLGANNVVWSNVTLCHDTQVGEHNFFASNTTVGGEVRIGSRCFLGFSSVVLQQRTVADDVLLGAQSLLMEDAKGLTQYHGSPARPVRSLDAAGVCVQ